MDEFEFSFRYPFTAAARQVIEDNVILVNDVVVELALERIKTALRDGRLPASIALHDGDRINAVAAYAAARMILGYSRNRFLTNAYAVAESKRAGKCLEKENGDIIDRVAMEFGIRCIKKEDNVLMPVYIYLKYSPRAVPYKLMNRELSQGYVRIKKEEMIRITEEAIRKHVEKIPLVKSPPPAIRLAAEKLKEFLPKIRNYEAGFSLAEGDMPPCIEKLMDSLKKHENLGHQARWYLAVYLLWGRMSVEQIMSIYSNLPDYSERTTKYQLEHARKKDYSVPACATVLTWGLCCADCRINSPLNWQKLGKAEKENLLKTGRRMSTTDQ